MAASQTIEKLQFGINQTATKESGSSSSAEKSNDFDNIFENINKNYSSDKKETQTRATEDTTSKNTATENTTTTKTDANTSSTETTTSNKKSVNQDTEQTETTASTPVSSEESQTTSTEVSSESPQETETTNVENNTISNNPNDTEINPEIELIQTPLAEQTPVVPQTEQAPQTQQTSGIAETVQPETGLSTENLATDETSLENVATQVESTTVNTDINADLKSDAKTEVKVKTKIETDAKTDSADELSFIGTQTSMVQEAAPKVTTKNEAEDDVSDSSIPAAPIKIAEATLDLLTQSAISGFASTATLTTPATNNPTINSETLAISGEINLNKDGNISTNTSKNVDAQSTGISLPLNGVQTQETQAPLVKVATEAVVSDVNTNTGDIQSNKNTNAKNPLTQETLDSLDAEVTSVETTNSANTSSNNNSDSNANAKQNPKNLLAQQNTQEQTIKLELLNNSVQNTATVDITTNAAATVQSFQSDLTSTTSASATTQTQPQYSTATEKELNQADIMSQINKQLNLKTTQNGETTKVNIILRPENLGKIELELVSTKDGLTAKMTADNAQVKEILDKSLNGLKESLSGQGINVNTVTVKINETQKQDTMFSFDQQTGQGNQQQNTQHTNEDKVAFNDKLNGISDNESSNEELEAETETLITNLSSTNVDYKV